MQKCFSLWRYPKRSLVVFCSLHKGPTTRPYTFHSLGRCMCLPSTRRTKDLASTGSRTRKKLRQCSQMEQIDCLCKKHTREWCAYSALYREGVLFLQHTSLAEKVRFSAARWDQQQQLLKMQKPVPISTKCEPNLSLLSLVRYWGLLWRIRALFIWSQRVIVSLRIEWKWKIPLVISTRHSLPYENLTKKVWLYKTKEAIDEMDL